MNKLEFKKLLSERIIILDGAMGSELRKRGFLDDVKAPEELNIKAPERLQAVYTDYLEAGSEVILSNTFGANRRLLSEYGLDPKLEVINTEAVRIAKETAGRYNALVGADVGPLGAYLSPLGPLSFDEAYGLFSEQIKALAKAGPDFIVLETMADIREVKAALLAAKEHFSGPVITQMTFTQDGSTVTGTDVLAFLSIAEAMGADAIGMNCSVGPKDMAPLVKRIAEHTTLPISFKPNAGMPTLINRKTVFPGTPEEFVAASETAYSYGANMLGGCCGTNPEFIKALAGRLKGKKPASRSAKPAFFLASRVKAVDISLKTGILKVGERINPTNRKKFQEELLAGNFATIRREAQEQVKSGADILDLNLGLPGGDETSLMKKAVEEIQESVSVPLCLDSSSTLALEAGLKACAGKPIINSVNGDIHKLTEILPLAKRYGAALVGLATDEKGIPKTAAERITIAARIIEKAKEYGIPEAEIIIDYLTLAASAMPGAVKDTLEAIRESKKRWPQVKTILGVSNVSFGLPGRQLLNSTFLKLARNAGLDMAILNPHEDWNAYDQLAENLLLGNDPSGSAYIQKYGLVPKKTAPKQQSEQKPEERLYFAVIEGNREEITGLTQEVLRTGKSPLEISNNILLEALNEVGKKFNSKEYFLPQVIRAAEAAQVSFGQIKPLLKKEGSLGTGKIVLATVKGDVHDIGKNIVAAVLESHGWEVIDLGKNVDADAVIEAAKKEKAPLIGLSALMTTTMLEMERVVQSRNASKLPFRIIVGGAPVTERFAKEIGADGYAKDAVQAAQIAKALINK